MSPVRTTPRRRRTARGTRADPHRRADAIRHHTWLQRGRDMRVPRMDEDAGDTRLDQLRLQRGRSTYAPRIRAAIDAYGRAMWASMRLRHARVADCGAALAVRVARRRFNEAAARACRGWGTLHGPERQGEPGVFSSGLPGRARKARVLRQPNPSSCQRAPSFQSIGGFRATPGGLTPPDRSNPRGEDSRNTCPPRTYITTARRSTPENVLPILWTTSFAPAAGPTSIRST